MGKANKVRKPLKTPFRKKRRLSVFFFFFLILGIVLGGGVLVLLVLRDEVVHVGLGFGELHLVHAFTGVPVEEGLAAEHGGELLGHALEHLLDGGGVTDEGAGHLEALGGMSQTADLTLFGIHSTKYEQFLFWTLSICSSTSFVDMRPRKMGDGEVAAVTGVAGAHHVLGVEHLLGELRDGEGAVLLGAAGRERGESRA